MHINNTTRIYTLYGICLNLNYLNLLYICILYTRFCRFLPLASTGLFFFFWFLSCPLPPDDASSCLLTKTFVRFATCQLTPAKLCRPKTLCAWNLEHGDTNKNWKSNWGKKKTLKSCTHEYITPNATMKRMAKRTTCTTNMTIIPITMIIAKITENNTEWSSKPHDVRDRYGTWKHPWRIICSAYLWQPVYGAKKCVYIMK